MNVEGYVGGYTVVTGGNKVNQPKLGYSWVGLEFDNKSYAVHASSLGQKNQNALCFVGHPVSLAKNTRGLSIYISVLHSP